MGRSRELERRCAGCSIPPAPGADRTENRMKNRLDQEEKFETEDEEDLAALEPASRVIPPNVWADKGIGGVMADDKVGFRYRASDTPDLTSLNNELLRRARREWERAETDLRSLCSPLIAKGYRLHEIRKTISRSGLNGPLRADVVGVVEVSRHLLAARRLWRRVSENSYSVNEIERLSQTHKLPGTRFLPFVVVICGRPVSEVKRRLP